MENTHPLWQDCQVGDVSPAYNIEDSEGVSHSAQGVSHSSTTTVQLYACSMFIPRAGARARILSALGNGVLPLFGISHSVESCSKSHLVHELATSQR